MLDHMAVLKGIAAKADRKAVVESLLAQTNLWNVRKKALAGFSGGMRQRFGIAQALIGNPELIIVDEPTAGLDPEERNRFLNLLAGIGDNVVVILSTHIVDDVADLSRDGVISEGGCDDRRPRAVMEQLRGRIWQKAIDTELSAPAGVPGDLAGPPSGGDPRPLEQPLDQVEAVEATSRTSTDHPQAAAQPERGPSCSRRSRSSSFARSSSVRCSGWCSACSS
jgi:energy-coupling factor transporter ATP-binding protein EcfA2